jgi:hypothetical protein
MDGAESSGACHDLQMIIATNDAAGRERCHTPPEYE